MNTPNDNENKDTNPPTFTEIAPGVWDYDGVMIFGSIPNYADEPIVVTERAERSN